MKDLKDLLDGPAGALLYPLALVAASGFALLALGLIGGAVCRAVGCR